MRIKYLKSCPEVKGRNVRIEKTLNVRTRSMPFFLNRLQYHYNEYRVLSAYSQGIFSKITDSERPVS
jgi:hypothetical protein